MNWDFCEGRVVPYVIGGAGWVRSEFRQFRPVFTVDRLFWKAGGGLKLHLTDRWYVAPEALLGWDLHFRASAAVGYMFRR